MTNFARIGKFVLAVVADFYLGAFAAGLVNRFWPSARLLALFVVTLSLIAIDFAAIIVEFHHGRHSTLTIWLIHVGFFFTGIAIVLFVGGLVERTFAEGWGTIVDTWGVMFWGTFVAASLRNSFHARKLQADLESPNKSVEEDQKEIRKYFHPYI